MNIIFETLKFMEWCLESFFSDRREIEYWQWYNRHYLVTVLPKAELNTRNSTKRRLTAPIGWVSGVKFGVRQMAVIKNCLLNHDQYTILCDRWKNFQDTIPYKLMFHKLYSKQFFRNLEYLLKILSAIAEKWIIIMI